MNAASTTPLSGAPLRGALPSAAVTICAALVLLLDQAPARAQGLLDAAAAAGAAGGGVGGGLGSERRTMDAIKGGAEKAMQTGAARRDAAMAGIDSQAAGGGGGAAAGPAPREGLIFYDQLQDPTGAGGGIEEREPVPEQYIVVKGDTLWSICQRFFGNPWYWPKLWSYNEMITNPHWIYPGDLLSMYPPGERPARPAARPEKQTPTARRLTRSGPPPPSGLVLRQNGFVEPDELTAAGKIIGSKEEKMMLSSLDEVYIEMNRKAPLKVGERYSIYRVTKVVRRPYGDKEVLGSVVEIQGEVQVRQVTPGGIARAVIRDALSPIERGYRVGPLRRTFKLVDPQKNAVNAEGVLVETLQPSSVLSSEMLLFMDLGRQSGLTIGNRLLVVRRGDGYQRLLGLDPVDDRRFPREVVAEIIIVDIRDKVSAGLITRSTKEIRLGDRVEARKGY
jgi:hypothetical protein